MAEKCHIEYMSLITHEWMNFCYNRSYIICLCFDTSGIFEIGDVKQSVIIYIRLMFVLCSATEQHLFSRNRRWIFFFLLVSYLLIWKGGTQANDSFFLLDMARRHYVSINQFSLFSFCFGLVFFQECVFIVRKTSYYNFLSVTHFQLAF